MGLEYLPAAVRSGSGTLPWLMIDNRPFLRAYHGLALKLPKRGKVERALEMFLQLLDWNPNDNQGVRELVKKIHRKPKGLRLHSVTLWSPEQAYLYWKERGRHWKKTPGALDLLREMLGERPAQET